MKQQKESSTKFFPYGEDFFFRHTWVARNWRCCHPFISHKLNSLPDKSRIKKSNCINCANNDSRFFSPFNRKIQPENIFLKLSMNTNEPMCLLYIKLRYETTEGITEKNFFRYGKFFLGRVVSDVFSSHSPLIGRKNE
jgi:hypothetical protein